MAGPLSLEAIAELVGGRLAGDGAVVIDGVAPVDEAEPRRIAFLAARKYAKYVENSAATAFLVSAELEAVLPESASRVVVDEAYPALRTLLEHFHPEPGWYPTVHATAVMGRDVELGAGVEVGPYAVLEAGVRVGDGCRIGAHCVIGQGTAIGPRTRLHPHVVTYHDTVIGADVIVHSGTRLGAEGFGYTFVEGRHAKIPQVGRCVIEDGVEIGANSTIDRGSLGDTRVGAGTKIDNLVHLAHNVRVGALTLIAAMVGVAGSTRIGKGVWLGGQSGVCNQVEIGDGARVAVQTGVTRDVPAGETVSGFPGRPHREALVKDANVGRIPRLLERVRRLEKEFKRLGGEH
jgi:UDP-3-O-[3-hydroxymyristoyl] glucosamine N-acyltransferase